MIQILLDKIFEQYVERFYELNNLEHREFMKWEAAYEFSNFDFDSSDDFLSRLKHLNKTCGVIIDKKSIHPFAMLCACAGIGPEYAERVRKMFQKLFSGDDSDLVTCQKRIDEFIIECDMIRSECGKNGYAYSNDQTAVMAYLALRNPQSHYLLSTNKARELGARVGFGDDWGTLRHFKMDVYYRFCDELADAMRQNPKLMEINQKRYASDFANNKHLPLYEDTQLHLLAFDIIYCASSETYNLGKVVPIDPIVAEKYKNAKEIYEHYLEARMRVDELTFAKERLKNIVSVGMPIKHKKFGAGIIHEVIANEKNEPVLRFEFEKTGIGEAKYGLIEMLTANILSLDSDEARNQIALYKEILKERTKIENTFRYFERQMEPYWEYI